MHTPAPRSLWLVPGRALLTRGECGEHGEEESRGGRGGPAGANPGRRVSGAGGSRRGRRRLLAGESCPYADGNCKYPPGECGEGCRGPRGRAAARVGASERERELPRALGGADRHAGRPAGPGGPLRVPSPGSAPPPNPLPPRPARSRLRLPAPAARRLHRRSSAAPSSSLPSPPLAIAPFSAPSPAARPDYRGERRGEPFGEPRNPRSPPRRRPRAGGVRAPLPSCCSERTAYSLRALPGLRNPSARPKEAFLNGWLLGVGREM